MAKRTEYKKIILNLVKNAGRLALDIVAPNAFKFVSTFPRNSRRKRYAIFTANEERRRKIIILSDNYNKEAGSLGREVARCYFRCMGENAGQKKFITRRDKKFRFYPIAKECLDLSI